MLVQVMQQMLICLGAVLAQGTITILVAPLVAVAYAPIVYIFEMLRRQYIATIREIKRLGSLAASPVLSSFTDTLQVRPHHAEWTAKLTMDCACIDARAGRSMLCLPEPVPLLPSCGWSAAVS